MFEIDYQLTEIDEIAKKIVSKAKSKVLLFYGDMGVGKTTLIKRISKLLGVDHVTSSPTFSIVNEYNSTESNIFHFDFYRLNDESEAYDMGLEDYFLNSSWCFVEWPEKIDINLLPDERHVIKISLLDNGYRKIIFQ